MACTCDTVANISATTELHFFKWCRFTQVTFHDGESYSWNKVTTYLNNLILGKIYIDHGGVMKISSAQSGLTARIRFKETGMLYDKNPRQVCCVLVLGCLACKNLSWCGLAQFHTR